MPACKNIKSKTFTGKENTPLGRGYHASGEKLNSIMKGKDGNKYKVVKTKSGKRWQKVNGRMKSPGRSSRGAGEFLNPYIIRESERRIKKREKKEKAPCYEVKDSLYKDLTEEEKRELKKKNEQPFMLTLPDREYEEKLDEMIDLVKKKWDEDCDEIRDQIDLAKILVLKYNNVGEAEKAIEDELYKN